MTASSIPLGGVNRTVEIVKRWLLSKGRSHSCFGYRCGGPGWAAIPDSPTRKYSDFRIDASDRGRVGVAESALAFRSSVLLLPSPRGEDHGMSSC
jgi:hypothetical protein